MRYICSPREQHLTAEETLTVLPVHLFRIHAEPFGPAWMRETDHRLTHPESAADARAEEAVDRLAGSWDEVNRGDIEIERVQQGPRHHAVSDGRLCYRYEEPLDRFQNMVIDPMVGVRRVSEGDEIESAPCVRALSINQALAR